MKAKVNSDSKSHFGAFLFFVIGLFLIQVIFAFTIHGDIGPQYQYLPSNFEANTKNLTSKVDSILRDSSQKSSIKIEPDKKLAPATKVSNLSKIVDSEIKKRNKPELIDKGFDFLEYKISFGESLHTIAKKFYGKPEMVTILARINRISDAKTLRCGQVLRLPKKGLLISEY